jgi:hypothetical protein
LGGDGRLIGLEEDVAASDQEGEDGQVQRVAGGVDHRGNQEGVGLRQDAEIIEDQAIGGGMEARKGGEKTRMMADEGIIELCGNAAESDLIELLNLEAMRNVETDFIGWSCRAMSVDHPGSFCRNPVSFTLAAVPDVAQWHLRLSFQSLLSRSRECEVAS